MISGFLFCNMSGVVTLLTIKGAFMKKRKNTFTLSIITLILCIGVMAVGVYSATTVLLNVNGTLGYQLHDAMVEMGVTIQNLVEEKIDGTYELITKQTKRYIKSAESTTTTNTLDFGDLQFSYGQPMIFTFVLKNLTTKSLITTITMPTLNSKVKTVSSSSYTTFPVNTAILTNSTYTITFALELTDETAQFSDIDFKLVFEFMKADIKQGVTVKKFTDIELEGSYLDLGFDDTGIKTISDGSYVSCYLKDMPYYIEQDSTWGKIRWSILGIFNTKTQAATRFVSLDNEHRKIISLGYLLEDYTYYLLSEKIISVNTARTYEDYGIAYQNNCTIVDETDENEYGYNETDIAFPNKSDFEVNYLYPNQKYLPASDYLTSNVRAYLTSSTGDIYRTAKYTETTVKGGPNNRLDLAKNYYEADTTQEVGLFLNAVDESFTEIYIVPRSVANMRMNVLVAGNATHGFNTSWELPSETDGDNPAHISLSDYTARAGTSRFEEILDAYWLPSESELLAYFAIDCSPNALILSKSTADPVVGNYWTRSGLMLNGSARERTWISSNCYSFSRYSELQELDLTVYNSNVGIRPACFI